MYASVVGHDAQSCPPDWRQAPSGWRGSPFSTQRTSGAPRSSPWQHQADGTSLFFSFNQTLKARDGLEETPIGDLRKGDKISFGIGVNYEGPCAIDVALVERAPDGPQEPSAPLPELVEIIEDAVKVCADEDGWALSATVGIRIRTLYPYFDERLKASGHQKLVSLVPAYPNMFEVSDGIGTRHAAACMRLKSDVLGIAG